MEAARVLALLGMKKKEALRHQQHPQDLVSHPFHGHVYFY